MEAQPVDFDKLKVASRRGMAVSVAGVLILIGSVVYSAIAVRRVQEVTDLYSQAKEHLRNGEQDEADAVFQMILHVDPDFPVNSTDARDLVAVQLLEEADRIVESGGNEADALLAKQRALDMSPRRKLVEAETLARTGDIPRAIELYQEVDASNSSYVTAGKWNTLCWQGALHRQAARVMFACENAVASDPEQGGYRDSRGLALALTDDIDGAIADFQFYVDWGRSGRRPEEMTQLRTHWIQQLQDGQNPFDDNLLRTLRGEVAYDPLISAISRLDRNRPLVLEPLTKALSADVILEELAKRNTEAEEDPDPSAWQDADRRWIAQGAEELVTQIEVSACSRRLQAIQAVRSPSGQQIFLEIFLTDKVGRNACQTNRTSDYLQNDEEWWTTTINSRTVNVSEVETDQSAGANAVSAHIPVIDQGAVVGVAKAVINVSAMISLREPIVIPG